MSNDYIPPALVVELNQQSKKSRNKAMLLVGANVAAWVAMLYINGKLVDRYFGTTPQQ